VHEKLFFFSARNIVLLTQALCLEQLCCPMRSKTSLRDYLPRCPFPFPDKEVGLKSEPSLKLLYQRAPPTYKFVLSWTGSENVGMAEVKYRGSSSYSTDFVPKMKALLMEYHCLVSSKFRPVTSLLLVQPSWDTRRFIVRDFGFDQPPLTRQSVRRRNCLNLQRN